MANLATISNNILADSGIDPITVIVGSGTVNYIPKFTASGTIGNSAITDNGTTVTLISRALAGTSATFTGAVLANNPSEGATGEGLIAGRSFKIDATGTSQRAIMYVVSNVLSDTYGSGLQIQGANFAGDKAFGFNLNTSGGFELLTKNVSSSFVKALTAKATQQIQFNQYGSGTFTGTRAYDLAIDSSGNIIEVAVGAGTVTGSGTANEITYWTGSSSIGSLTTATYPSLTELSYVKGVTSAIQTQLNGKLSLSGGTMTGQIILKESTNSTDYTKGLRFPNDPYGGSGDTSGLRLYADTSTGVEAQVLELYVTNDGAGAAQDRINFFAPSNDLVTINGNKIWNAGNLPTPASGTGTTNYISKWTSSSGIGNSSMYDDGANIGIGTITPGARLEISSSGLGDGGGLRITNSGTGGNSYRIWATANINGEGAGKLIFTNNAGNVMTFSSNGYVGVGTTDPLVKMDVVGSMYVRSGTFYADTISPYTGNQLTMLAGGSNYIYVNGKLGVGTAVLGIYSLRTSGIFKAEATFSTYVNDGLYNANALPSAIGLPNGYNIFFGYYSSGDGNYYGRIGTDGPNSSKVSFGALTENVFTVATGTGNTERFRVDNSGISITGDLVSTGYGSFKELYLNRNDGVSPAFVIKYFNYYRFVTETTGYSVNVGIPAANSMFIDGNLSVGSSSSSSSRLYVSGSTNNSLPIIDIVTSGTTTFQRGVRMLNGGMVSGNALMYAVGQSDNAKNMAQYYFYYNGSGSNSNRLSLGLHSVDDKFNIFGSGNISINTTTDLSVALGVAGSVKALGGNFASTDGTVNNEVSHSGSGGLIGTTTSHALLIRTAAATAATVDTSQQFSFAAKISVPNATGVLFNGIADNNWKMYRSATPDFTRSLITAGNASLNINAHYGGEGFAIGANGGYSYYEILGSSTTTPQHFLRGYIGINTSPNTSYNLTISGGTIATGNIVLDASGGQRIYQIQQDATHTLDVRWIYNAIVANAYASINTYNYSNAIYIDGSKIILQANSGNNVGIGNTGPDRKLYVADSSDTQGTFLAYNQGASYTGTVITAITDRAANSAFTLMNLKSSTASMFSVRGDGYTVINGTGSGSFSSQLTLNNTTSSPALITFQNTANGHAFGFTSTGTQRFTFLNGGISEIAYITNAGAAYFASTATFAGGQSNAQFVFGDYGIGMSRSSTYNGIWFNSGTDQNHVLWNDYYGGPTTRTATPSGFDGIKWNTYRGIVFYGGSAGASTLLAITNSGGATADHYVRLYASGTERLATTTSGVSITGSANISGQAFFTCGFSTYTTDGLFSAQAVYSAVATPGASNRIRFGYNDYGGGQYFGAIGFNANTNFSIGHRYSSDGNYWGMGTGYRGEALILNSSNQVYIPTKLSIGSWDSNGAGLNLRNYGVADATTDFGFILDRGTKIAWTNGTNGTTGEYIYSQQSSPYAITIHSGSYNAFACPNTGHVYINYEAGTCSIGSTSFSTSYKLYVTGSIYATGDVIGYSDRRKKENIVTIDNALEKVSALRGVFYNKINESERNLGVIAQEVLDIVPEAVSYAKDTDEYGVKYGNIVGLLIEAIKEQQKQIDELKKNQA
jgi:Chaperone of endosialidase